MTQTHPIPPIYNENSKILILIKNLVIFKFTIDK
jgi:hypothetical protein